MGFWDGLLAYGARHGVDPLVFAGLYATRMPLLLAGFGWIAARARRHRPIVGVAILAILLWLIPYAYVFVFGHDLPWWFYLLLGLLAVLSGRQLVRRLRNPAGLEETGVSGVADPAG